MGEVMQCPQRAILVQQDIGALDVPMESLRFFGPAKRSSLVCAIQFFKGFFGDQKIKEKRLM